MNDGTIRQLDAATGNPEATHVLVSGTAPVMAAPVLAALDEFVVSGFDQSGLRTHKLCLPLQ